MSGCMQLENMSLETINAYCTLMLDLKQINISMHFKISNDAVTI